MHGRNPEGIQKKAALVFMPEVCYLSLTNERVKLES